MTALGCEDGRTVAVPGLSSGPGGRPPTLPACPAARRTCRALHGLRGGYRRALFSNKQAEGLLFLSTITGFFPAVARKEVTHCLFLQAEEKPTADYLTHPKPPL